MKSLMKWGLCCGLAGSSLSVELQRQFLALRRAGALPLQARLERRSLSSCALLTHRELSFVFSLGASLPPFLPNQATLQLHFRCSHELRTLSETFHTELVPPLRTLSPGRILLRRVGLTTLNLQIVLFSLDVKLLSEHRPIPNVLNRETQLAELLDFRCIVNALWLRPVGSQWACCKHCISRCCWN